MPITVYEHRDSEIHGFTGIEVDIGEIQKHFPNEVFKILKDSQGTEELISEFSTSLSLTGFATNQVFIDVFSIDYDYNEWRIGEAYAEFFLERNKNARFYWNELRDQRNLNSSKTGADLVGFIDLRGQTVFLFGEVKTSNDMHYPPQVLFGKTGMIKQLENLIEIPTKISTLIRYLGIKAMLFDPSHPFRINYEAALTSYITTKEKYCLVGVLVRDVPSNESDLKARYKALKSKINSLPGLELLALYIPITQNEWKALVESKNE